MNKVIVLLFGVLVLSACSDQFEYKNQESIGALQSEVMTLKNRVVALEGNMAENDKALSSINIGPEIFKSELDAELASAALHRGIEFIELRSDDSGETDLVLFLQDGKEFKRIHSEKDFSSELNPYNGYVRERITFLIAAEPDDDQATLLKKIILSILQDKEQV